jgi:hypothetical protein
MFLEDLKLLFNTKIEFLFWFKCFIRVMVQLFLVSRKVNSLFYIVIIKKNNKFLKENRLSEN